MNRKDVYIDMFVGVLFFLGGMLTIYLIMKHLQRKPIELLPHMVLKEVNQQVNPVLEKIEKNISMQIPKGEVTDMLTEVSDSVKMLYNEKSKGLNWSSFTVTNVGGSPVYMAVNTWRRPESPIYPGENIDVDFRQRGAIKKIYLVCDKGENTTVKIHAIKWGGSSCQ